MIPAIFERPWHLPHAIFSTPEIRPIKSVNTGIVFCLQTAGPLSDYPPRIDECGMGRATGFLGQQ